MSSKGVIWGETIGSYILLFIISGLGGVIFHTLSYGLRIPFWNKQLGPYIKSVKIPPLLGMIMGGSILANIKGGFLLDPVKDCTQVNSVLRNTALFIILFKGGLGINLAAIQKQKCKSLGLACLPQTMEALLVGGLSIALLKMDVYLAIGMGYMVAGISPAVLIPSVSLLISQGYISEILSILLGSGTLDVILSINMFLLFVGTKFVGEGNFLSFLGPFSYPILALLQIVLGIVFGILWGSLLGKWKNNDKSPKRDNILKCISIYTFGILLVGSLIVLRRITGIDFVNCGLLLVVTSNAKLKQYWNLSTISLSTLISNKTWLYLQVFLFGLVGESARFSDELWDNFHYYLIILFSGTLLRALTAFCCAMGGSLLKERMFAGLAWIPKATVQAALAAVIADRNEENDENYYDEGQHAILLGMLYIIICAPTGAIFIASFGPKWLKKLTVVQEEKKNDSQILEIEIGDPGDNEPKSIA